VFILATTESHKVPDTIISRTQRFNFKPIDAKEVSKHLRVIAKKESINISDEALMLISEYGNGSFRDSISMLDQIAGFSNTEITSENIDTLLGSPDETILNDIIQAILINDVEAMFDLVQNLREKGTNPSKTSQSLIKILRKEIVSGQNPLDAKISIKLMKALLPLTGAQSSFEAIEIALLDCINFENQQIKTKDKKLVAIQKPQKELKPIIELQTTSDIPQSKVQVTIPEDKLRESLEDNNTKGSWNDVLNALKSDHNTLYGVLRMAETKVEKDKIILIFQFEFHKKQLNQSKNIATLKSIVDNKLGLGYKIESEVVKKQKITSDKKVTNNSDDTLSSVSNIFGGAELLES
jgi:DNA polymerase-3 subunit gamma/tau